ncbi:MULTISPECIES: methionine ABC transporter ATP-binding protein [Commensalibacter]|uniref:Cell division ATP-binding protein FtsE n=1 Tax=Commensalibacter melissae TaxID=2070537 RepID=A0A318N059_9PROT|nr:MULTISPECIES: methionine ABC transporter ATP-binding protein [Commensalibacter]AYN87095.1 methionine ABC transporter ATP-binding protein [Commensalibacter melissae]MBH9973064.1 methionine ABC transporter ATP-binding protein [Commensalibacter melissae]MBI0016330.1 methionine ABC transporter ATP-binding protein [Commensalibacter sp. B14384M2]MBI0018081.1 methionine ABC transporter ATP-binding protein [Commensalibacter sp. W8133]MBI0049203.1 methionine ABC transporter ATP-binding protein [Comm
MTSDLPVIEFDNVCRNFGNHAALSNLTFSIQKGEIVGIIGHSGAGKTTLLRCLAGLEKPTSGKVKIEGKDIAHLPEKALIPLRQRIGLVFQHFNLLNSKNVLNNIALPLKIAGIPKAKRIEKAKELLELVGIPDKALNYPAQLSGGQKQRVGIARALAANPALLLCDEATSALDPETTRSIIELLLRINQKLKLTIVLITHEMSVIRLLADRVFVLQKGKIIEEGAVGKVFAHPQSETTQQLLQEEQPSLPQSISQNIHPNPDRNDHAILHVVMMGKVVRDPLIANLQKDYQISAVLLEGNITHIRETPIGTTFLAVPADQWQQTITALTSMGVETVEKVGYVRL